MRTAKPNSPNRRAIALIIAVTLLSVTNLILTGVIAASGDDAYLAKLRTDRIRSQYAAQSALHAAIRLQSDDPENPLTGTLTYPGGAEAEIVDPFDAAPDPPGELIVEGRFGQARHKIATTIE